MYSNSADKNKKNNQNLIIIKEKEIQQSGQLHYDHMPRGGGEGRGVKW